MTGEEEKEEVGGCLLFMPITPQPSVDDMSQLCAVSEPAGKEGESWGGGEAAFREW